jgi:hypothetical protein
MMRVVRSVLALAALLLTSADRGALPLRVAQQGRGGPGAAHPAAPKPIGTVSGVLHHKGCQTVAGGAAVAVIGREVSARTDTRGAFSLSLPPGTYSLVISGPNLVADQRVDDVPVVLGRNHDLGEVEVWPEERPPGCIPTVEPEPSEDVVVAVAPDTPAVDLPGTSVAPIQPAPEQVLARLPTGAGPGQAGVQGNPARDDEDALGPPSFAVGPLGSLYLLDAINARVQRFDLRGRFVSSFPLSRQETPSLESDLVVTDDGNVLVFSNGEPSSLTQYDLTGRVLVSAPLPSSLKGVDLLFAGRQRPIFLMQNGQAVRAELGWGGLRAEGPLPGFPVGDLFVRAERVSRWRAAIKLLSADGRVRRSVQLRSNVPIADVRLIGVNRKGEIAVALDRSEGAEDAPPQAEVLLLELTPQGRMVGLASVPPGDRRFEFREFALGPDNGVVQMQSDAHEVRFVRWVPMPYRSGGEGLVKGRVFDGGRPSATAGVTVGRARRIVPVSSDGTFEVRLPAGTYTVSFRRAAAGAAPEQATVELKVAVAAGATVDLGNVSINTATPPPARSGLGSATPPGAAPPKPTDPGLPHAPANRP